MFISCGQSNDAVPDKELVNVNFSVRTMEQSIEPMGSRSGEADQMEYLLFSFVKEGYEPFLIEKYKYKGEDITTFEIKLQPGVYRVSGILTNWKGPNYGNPTIANSFTAPMVRYPSDQLLMSASEVQYYTGIFTINQNGNEYFTLELKRVPLGQVAYQNTDDSFPTGKTLRFFVRDLVGDEERKYKFNMVTEEMVEDLYPADMNQYPIHCMPIREAGAYVQGSFLAPEELSVEVMIWEETDVAKGMIQKVEGVKLYRGKRVVLKGNYYEGAYSGSSDIVVLPPYDWDANEEIVDI